MHYSTPDTNIEHIYYYDREAARTKKVLHGSSSKASSEGMTNDRSSCWMISVIQALRGSSAFRKEFAPLQSENNVLKSELFSLFDIAEGKNGQRRRPVRHDEIRGFKRLAIDEGLETEMDKAFLEQPFLKFLLQKLDADPVEYYYSKRQIKQKKTIFAVSPQISEKTRTLQSLIKNDKITFINKSKTPKFLPVYLNRPLERRYYGENKSRLEFSRTPVSPSCVLDIPLAKNEGRARYSLVSIIIGRDSSGHAYSYVFEKDPKGKSIWVEYNDANVIVHNEPETKKRRKDSNHTPFEDATKHSLILIYEFVEFIQDSAIEKKSSL